MARGTHLIYSTSSGHKQHGAISATEAWVCCKMLVFLCQMHSWFRAEWGCNPTPCPRGSPVLAEALQGGQAAEQGGVTQCPNNPHICLSWAETDQGVQWTLHPNWACVGPWGKDSVALGLCCPALKSKSERYGGSVWAAEHRFVQRGRGWPRCRRGRHREAFFKLSLWMLAVGLGPGC